MGGSSPNSDFFFYLEMLFLFFFCVVFVVLHVSKKNKKMDMGVGGWMVSVQSKFFSDFWIF